MARNKKDPTLSLILGGAGFILGMGAVFIFATRKGDKYRKQLGELSADFLDAVADGCQEFRKSVLK
jgi:hypothetical protein